MQLTTKWLARQISSWFENDSPQKFPLNDFQENKLSQTSWRRANSKWTYFSWLSIGLYAGIALTVQGLRAKNKRVTKFGLLHIFFLFIWGRMSESESVSSGFIAFIYSMVAIFLVVFGLLFTKWSIPEILRWKAGKLDGTPFRNSALQQNVEKTEASLEDATKPDKNQENNLDIRVDGADKGPRKLDF